MINGKNAEDRPRADAGRSLDQTLPLITEVVSIFRSVPLIRRQGIISAWDDPEFVAAVEKTGRKNLMMTGVPVDVCLAFPAMQAVEAGYNVCGIVDAFGGSRPQVRAKRGYAASWSL